MALTTRIDSGLVEGSETGGVTSFKGIPFAKPPVGSLRWRAPQPVEPWSGTLNATAFRHDCVQAPGNFETLTVPESEDCLYLNVWKPADAVAGDLLPVMVWIHGGGFVGGGTSSPVYDGTSFARDGIVTVSFNYRLGRIGFFGHPSLAEESPGTSVNYGYLDQIAALNWVNANIDAFGGDPDRVTIVGQSAGGQSVLHLMTSPVVGNVFHQAMAMSGGGRLALLDQPLHGERRSAEAVDTHFAAKQGINGTDANSLARLRDLDPATIAGRDNVGILGFKKMLDLSIGGFPIVDGQTVVGEPRDHFPQGNFKRVPLIIGSVAGDLPLHFPPSKLHPFEWFGSDEELARENYTPTGRLHGPIDHIKMLTQISADISMHEPARFVARAVAAAGLPVWLYRFTYTAQSERPGSVEQSHSGELPFLFQTLEAPYGKAVADADRDTAAAFHDYVVSFVKTGTPNRNGLPPWPTVDSNEPMLMNFTLDDGPTYGPDPRPGVELVARAQEREPLDD